ncbi:MAG: T9SS type A sorting domain-containing protein, partial [Bacteroidota bacterium]
FKLITDRFENLDGFYLDELKVLAVNSQSTSNEDLLQESVDFSIYPNPVSERLSIEIHNNRPSFIKIINSLGEIIFSERVNTIDKNINTSHLPSGIYYVIIDQDQGMGSKKVIKP